MTELLAVLGNPMTRPEGADGIAALMNLQEVSVTTTPDRTKTCHACKQVKPLDAFGIYSASRDGRRSSCKECVKSGRTKRSPKAGPDKSLRRLWDVAERDDDVALVRSWGVDDVLVSWDGSGWSCSTCGAQPRDGVAQEVCEHAATATRTLPLSIATRIASQVAPPGRQATLLRPSKPQSATDDDTQASRDAAAYEHRAARLAELDREAAERRQVTGAVTVRRMTDAERQDLAERRAERRRRFGPPEPDNRLSRPWSV